MDHQNILRASDYINNLLLSRGLLRNSAKIDFAPLPASSKHHKPSSSTENTAAQIINLVHDLVLQHDTSASQREILSTNLRSMRAAEAQNTARIGSLEAERAALARQLAIAQGRERAVNATVKKAESAAKSLRDEMARLKTCLSQVRTSCANDVRKRDVQISRLKGQLTTQQRGTQKPISASTIRITTGVAAGSQSGFMGGSNGSAAGGERREVEGEAKSLNDPGYSLRQETTEFLTGLSQSLSDENDALIALVRDSVVKLRAMQGLPATTTSHTEIDGQGESVSSSDGSRLALVQTVPDYETLANEMYDVLEQLRTLLTSPSFVPVEEVEARDEEILRLREGWVLMEGKWREAVGLMDGWRKRMAEGGRVEIEELKMGLGVGVGLDGGKREGEKAKWDEEERDGKDGHDSGVASCESPVTEASHEKDLTDSQKFQEPSSDMPNGSETLDQFEANTTKHSAGSPSTQDNPDEVVERLEVLDETNASQDEQSTDLSNVGESSDAITEAPGVLRETDWNARPEPSPRKVSFNISPSPETDSLDELALLDESSPTPAPRHRLAEKGPSHECSSLIYSQSKRKSIASPITIQQKLREVEAEAEAVSVTRRDENSSGGSKAIARKGGRRKRKSTLSPEELESLIAGF